MWQYFGLLRWEMKKNFCKSSMNLNYSFTFLKGKILHNFWTKIGISGQSGVIPVEELRSSSTEKVKRMST